MRDIEIVVLSDDIRGHSGFAVNARLICWALSERWNVANASLESVQPDTTAIRGRQIDIIPSHTPHEVHPEQMQELGKEGMQEIVALYDPDVVLSVIDPQMCSYIGKMKVPMTADVKIRDPGESVDVDNVAEKTREELGSLDLTPDFEWVAHTPVDARPLPDDWWKFFADVDYTVAMSDFGQEIISDQFDVDPYVIPHGVDFRRVEDHSSPGFLVGAVNRNQFRKQYPRLIESWGKFYDRAGRPDDVSFYIHADYEDDMGWPLDRYIDMYDIEEAVIPYQGKVDRRELMRLYNQFDVFTSATGGEGFGLTTIEAMSQQCPVLITDYTTSEEIVTNSDPSPRGSLIEPSLLYDEHPEFAAGKRALVDTDEFADTLLEYYRDPERVVVEGENAQQWVLSELDWNTVARQWVELFEEEVMNEGW